MTSEEVEEAGAVFLHKAGDALTTFATAALIIATSAKEFVACIVSEWEKEQKGKAAT